LVRNFRLPAWFRFSTGTDLAGSDAKRRFAMGELTEKAKGVGNDIAGKTKEALGKATDNAKLQVEGEAQQAKGAAQKVKGSVEGALGNKI
jgi:uncharacterized protein YjbJ (UPF0337 family)